MNRVSGGLLLAAAAVGLGVSSASAQQFINNFGNGIDPDTGAGDNLWSNPANWNAPIPDGAATPAWINVSSAHENQGGPATINYAAPLMGEIVVGQGAGDGHVLMTSGGSISAAALTMAWGELRNGIFDQTGGSTVLRGTSDIGRPDGGIATINISGGTFESGGALNIGRGNQESHMTVSGGLVTTAGTSAIRLSSVDASATATSSLTVSGGEVRIGALSGNQRSAGGNLEIGHLGGNARVDVTGGIVRANNVLVANLGTTTASGALNITGGEFHSNQIGVGASTGTGVGHLTIGGDAVVTANNHIFLRPDGRGVFTVEGSDATITLFRAAGTTGFEVTNGSIVNFIADAGGFSTVNIPNSTMRFSGPDGILNVDAVALEIGTYDLFNFGGGYWNTGFTTFGTENLLFAEGFSGSVLYNANSIQLQVIPEPSTYAAIFGGLILLGAIARRRFRK